MILTSQNTNEIPKKGMEFGGIFLIILLMIACFNLLENTTATAKEVNESNKYLLRLMTQTFDGARDFSHTQQAGIARMRKGNESYVKMDFHDGAVVIEKPGQLSQGKFKNTSGTEAEFIYNYDTNTLTGHNGVATYFNTYVRPLLKGNPKLGVNANWVREISLAQLGSKVQSSEKLSIELERKYFTHNGNDYALVRYQVPAFSYKLEDKTTVIHWGKGVALSDPGFGIIYWNASIQRAIAQQPGEERSRPYRYAKTLAAVDKKGQPLVDPRNIKEVASYFKDYYAPAKTQVLPFQDNNDEVDQTPITLAATVDVMALSLGENSANQLAEITGQTYGGDRGAEVGGYVDAAIDGYGLPDKFLAALGGLAEMSDNDLKQLEAYTDQIVSAAKSAKLKTGVLAAKIKQTSSDINKLKQSLQVHIAEAKTVDQLFDKKAVQTMSRIEKMTEDSQKLVGELNDLNKELSGLAEVKKQLPLLQKAKDAFASRGVVKFAKGLGNVLEKVDGPLGFLGGVGNMAEVYGTASSLAEFDPSDKDLNLTGNYGSPLEITQDLALNVIGIAGNAYSGNIVATATDVITFSSGRFTDLYKTYEAAQHAERQSDQSHMELIVTMKKAVNQAERKSQQDLKEMKAGYQFVYTDDDPYADGYNVYHPNWDFKKGEWKEGTRQWRAEEEARNKIKDKLKNTNTNQPSAADWAKFNADIANIRDPYPKARKKNYKTKTQSKTPEKQYSDIPDWLTKIWEELPAKIRKEKLDIYQSEKLKQQRELRELKKEERRDRIKYGGLWDEPVVFEQVYWEPPEWTPPKWVPPKFEAPMSSIIDFTSFDGSKDPNWLGFASVMAFQYEGLSGTVETDLSQWSEWLMTQDVRRLERTALEAGYPNLASALADWQNLISNANSQGFRKWANTAPSCNGYAGCGPQYLERWTMKKAQLALGDILSDSRDIFSTKGLSDITISGFLLNYLLRDFGLEDGDIVNVVVKQFGRVISRSNLSLLNAGTSFSINLRHGVASVEITAVNEGQYSPNTAQINISNVRNGEESQSYSLKTGETATLKVVPGK